MQKMESDQEAFSVAVRSVTEELGIGRGARDVVELFDEIESRVTAATLGQSKKTKRAIPSASSRRNAWRSRNPVVDMITEKRRCSLTLAYSHSPTLLATSCRSTNASA